MNKGMLAVGRAKEWILPLDPLDNYSSNDTPPTVCVCVFVCVSVFVLYVCLHVCENGHGRLLTGL